MHQDIQLQGKCKSWPFGMNEQEIHDGIHVKIRTKTFNKNSIPVCKDGVLYIFVTVNATKISVKKL